MANTISTTLAINDNMSKAFQSMNKSINLLISSFESLERSSSNAIDTKSLSQARKYINDAQTAFEDVDESIKRAKKSQEQLNDDISKGNNHAEKLKSAFGTIAKVGATAIAGLATGIGAAVGASVKEFADFEQLVGGVQTLFGAGGMDFDEYAAANGGATAQVQQQFQSLMNAQNTVLNDAQNAYKTAGLSANEYMETVTGFSASLISSLGGDTTKAASYANQALVDMSDNVNKMGTDMESIKNAYQGFAKQNYTMLDNLKLGYGGTKEEMQRLLQDAQKLTGQKYDISSFADITQAIHAIQTQMDITGTTAKEASTTISGSFNSMKSAFKNTLTALTTGGDLFDNSLQALIDTATTFGENILPAVQSALSGVGKLIENLAPVISAAIPTIISDVLPSLIDGAIQLIISIKDALIENKDILFEAASELVSTLVNGIYKLFTGSELDPSIFDSLASSIENAFNFVSDLLGGIANFVGSDAGIVTLAAAFTALGLAVAAIKISSFISKIKGLSDVGTFAGGLKALAMNTQLAAAAQWLFNTSLFGCPIIWIIAAIAALVAIIVLCVKHWDKIKEVALTCWEAIKSAWGVAVDWFKGIWESIKNGAVAIWEGIKSVFRTVIDWIKQNFVSIIAFIINPFAGVFSYLYNNCEGFRNIVNNVINAIKNFFIGLWESIKSGAQSAWGAITGVFTSIWNTISPLVMAIWNLISTVFTTIASIISAILQGIWATMQRVWTAISTTISNACTAIWNKIVAIWNAIVAFIAPILQSIWNTITNVWNAIWTTITTVCTAIWNTIVSIWNAIVSAVRTAINAVKSVITSIWNNIKSVTTSIWNNIKNKISETWNNIVSTVANKVKEVYTKIKSKFDEILNFLGGLKDKMLQKGKDIIQGLIDGISSKINAIADKIKEVGSTITNGIKNFFEIGSPSKVMHALGEFTFAGFNNGLQAMIDKIKRTTVNMGEVVTNVLPVQQNKPVNELKTREDFAAMRQVVSNKTNTYTSVKAPITVQVKNSNNFKTEADLSKFTRNLANGIAQQIGMQLEGVY